MIAMQHPPTSPGSSPANTPALSTVEDAQAATLLAVIESAIAEYGGALPFDRYMELALYAPGCGYYASGTQKFGAQGDFITAPELTPLFSQCLAAQCAEVFALTGGGEVLEFGAGSGVMAADVLLELERLAQLPVSYSIIELSAELQHRQRAQIAARVPHLLDRVHWLSQLPEAGFRGVVLANEVLDAMPVHRFRIAADAVLEQFVGLAEGGLETRWGQVRTPGLSDAVRRALASLPALPDGYESEINLRLAPWLHALAQCLDTGALLLIDYGYTRREYLHPERGMGTLVCHFRQRAHGDPLFLPGLQDITASVDFSAVAEAARTAGLEMAGYTTQANFLLGCGLDVLLARSDPTQAADHLRTLQAVKQLMLPSEMGERFKVMGLTRRIEPSLRGFSTRDLSDRL